MLLQKAGDVSNAFIRKDATNSLDEMVKNASAGKVLTALLASGIKSVLSEDVRQLLKFQK